MFSDIFISLTDTSPFPWQQALFECFSRGEVPDAADLPTGVGKTSVVAIWLIALLTHPKQVPRRLVYVVNRRTVVDQTTTEVERLRERLIERPNLLALLFKLCAVPTEMPLAISTLRGQFADNREWCTDPTRPAVVVGTVDMIGSGLLFSRYTCGFKARPHHAALLGQDALIVHDEAHLEPAFQTLLNSIAIEQKRFNENRRLRVMQLSATNRNVGVINSSPNVLQLSAADEANETIRRRIHATKQLRLIAIPDEKGLVERLGDLALARSASGRAVLVFVRTVDAVQKIEATLAKAQLQVVVLTGTMRGEERDKLVREPQFLRFLPPSGRSNSAPEPAHGTVYLIATSAGEVGVNLSADELICDLSTFESMAQRFGRVNRFGDLTDSTIDVVHPEIFGADDAIEEARSRTLDLLRQLNSNASPHALGGLDATNRSNAFSPPPKVRPANDILFDVWAMTCIRKALPGRPPVAPFLHGEPEGEEPETYVAWRSEVEIINNSLSLLYPPDELIADFPLKPHELLRDRSSRVREALRKIAERMADDKRDLRIWIISEDSSVNSEQLRSFLEKDSEDLISGCTVLLPPSFGGLSSRGLLDGSLLPSENPRLDVADITDGPNGNPLRIRIRINTPEVPLAYTDLQLIRMVDTLRADEDPDEKSEDALKTRYWLWIESPKASGSESKQNSGVSISLIEHLGDVEAHAREIASKLGLSPQIAHCLVLAARFHDLGKRRVFWQRGIGNTAADLWLAKPGRELRRSPIAELYRHEFGSLSDAERQRDFLALRPDEKDLVLHLVAAHHGRGRPYFPEDEVFDPGLTNADSQRIATEVPRRFARLQRRFGRWGLAYLESLLRAADYTASAGIKPLSGPKQ